MSHKRSWLKRTLIWAGPIITILLLVLAGFLYWVLTTTAGARWALVTAVRPLGGSVLEVSGSVWDGLRLGRLTLPLDQAHIRSSNIYLEVDWKRLLERHLQVNEISVGYLQVDVAEQSDKKDNNEPFSMPSIPITASIDKLTLGGLQIAQSHNWLPFALGNTRASAQLNQSSANVNINELEFHFLESGKVFNTNLNAQLTLKELSDSLPFEANIDALSESVGEGEVLCARSYMDSLPVDEESNCDLRTLLSASGDLQNVKATLDAKGQGLDLILLANIDLESGFPLRDADIDLVMSDGSSLKANIDWLPIYSDSDEVGSHVVKASLNAHGLDVEGISGGALPLTGLGASVNSVVQLDTEFMPSSVILDTKIENGTKWLNENLEGTIKAGLQGGVSDWRSLVVSALNTDVTIGANHVVSNGTFGFDEASWELSVDAPKLSDFWPGLPGAIVASAEITGQIKDHGAHLKLRHTPDNATNKPGEAPSQIDLVLNGSWGTNEQFPDQESWVGSLGSIQAEHAGLEVSSNSPMELQFMPFASGDQQMWHAGSSDIVLSLNQVSVVDVRHRNSYGTANGLWSSSGEVPQIEINDKLIKQIEDLLDLVVDDSSKDLRNRGGVKVVGAEGGPETRITMAMDWDVTADEALRGTLNLNRISGDLMVPADEPFPLGLQDFQLAVRAVPAAGGRSNINADLAISTADMGNVSGTASVVLSKTPEGFGIRDQDPIKANINADIDDLAWLSLVAGDALEFGGAVNADLDFTANLNGNWSGSGSINGSDLKIIRVDDGMRLLDGRMTVVLDDDRLVIQELYFPASLRVIPSERRTKTWLSSEEAANGSLNVSGDWSFSDFAGDIQVKLDRFPVLQRADRFAMFSGELDISAMLPAVSVTGKLVADAGWFDIDMLGGIATVDSDVVVLYGDEDPEEDVDVPMDISLSLGVDLGDRFYLTGFGVNTGLVGTLQVVMVDNKLTGMGALRTRGGIIEAYGQRLSLRRGTVTFQGDIANPILDIEALRTGLAVEAGVKVAGTAKKPRIDLVSYPNVNEVEKLSWLLFGHGPDESSGDMALLISVGTALLGDGEPFYRKFGIDEVSLQAGDVASVGSVLPVETVVSGVSSDSSELEQQFISVSKNMSRDFTIGIRQALADTGTVARVSYALARGLTAELSVGTTNGLALVYRWFSLD